MFAEIRWFEPPVVLGKDFRVRGIGIQEAMPPCLIDRPAGTGDWLLMGFSTPVHIGTSIGERLFLKHHLVLWPPGAWQYYGHPEATYTHSWIHCEGAFVERLCRKCGMAVDTVIPLDDWYGMEAVLRQLSMELQREEGADGAIARAYFEILLRTIARQGKHAPVGMPKNIREVCMYLEQNLSSQITLEALAQRAHCSAPYLCELFARWVGTPPIDYLIRLRIRAATYYLYDRNKRIGEIARLVGYEDLYYFSRLFKQRTGLSPRAMRTKLLGGE